MAYDLEKSMSVEDRIFAAKNLVVRPQDMDTPVQKELEEVLKNFKEKLDLEERGKGYYHIIIKGEYNRDILNKVVEIYQKVGWFLVVCRTSSEAGERAGLTGLQLWRKNI